MNNRQIKLAQRPEGLPTKETWRLDDSPVPQLVEHQVLMLNKYVSLDPTMRGWIRDRPSYLPPVPLDTVMRAITVSQVIKSNHLDMPVGSLWQGMGGVQEYTVTDGKGWRRIDPVLAPLPQYLSVLGMTGMTAYFGLLHVGSLQPGESVLISGAAGAVGSVAGQIAKLKGCRVIGIAGSDKKCQYLTDTLGWDGAINYKTANMYRAIGKHFPDRVDVYFDNVGGPILDAALAHINLRGRVVMCGGISQYNVDSSPYGIKNTMSLVVNRGRMEGFIVFDFAKQYSKAGQDLWQWLQEDKIKSEECIVYGLEQFNDNFLKLFSGEKRGKLILALDDA